MDSSPLVSIIIPAFLTGRGSAGLLTETLRSVSEQTFRDFEVIVVDDGSPFDGEPMARESALPVQWLRRSNGGSAMARNTGIAASRGAYLVFLDADDLLLPRALEAGLAALAAHHACAFAVGRREEMTFSGELVSWGVPSAPREQELYRILLAFEWYIIPPSSAIFRRAAVQQAGGFRDPWGADDLDFYLRVARRSPGCCYEDPPVTRYRRYSESSSRDGRRMLHSIREVYRREWLFVHGHPELEEAWRTGLRLLTEIFRDCVAENLRDRLARGAWRGAAGSAALLGRESPRRLLAELQRYLGRPAAETEPLIADAGG